MSATKSADSYKTRSSLKNNGKELHFYSLKKFEAASKSDLGRLPFSLKILLENLLRHEDGVGVTKNHILAIAGWDAKATPDQEIEYMPARILMQDFTGVPAVVDLAAMRGAVKRLGGNPNRINPLQPTDLVIDHSIQVDYFGTADALKKNTEMEFKRNRERYLFLKWGQTAFENFSVVPPETGICHQVNLEYLARVAMTGERNGETYVFPDTLVGTDSHTTMINGLGVLGWGVGGIEAEAAMLGQPISMLIPQVVGFRLKGKLAAGATATDLVLTVTQMLRKKGVVGKFVEFFGAGISGLSLADRATIANMAPEYGATCGIFPVDEQTIAYLNLTNRSEAAELTEAYYKEQGLWYSPEREPEYTDTLELDLSTVEPSLAGPSRPQDRVTLSEISTSFLKALPTLAQGKSDQCAPDTEPSVAVNDPSGAKYKLGHGSVVIAAITSCTNTSNPSVLVAAGLLAKRAVEKGLSVKPWVKTSLAPGSKVVTDYLTDAGLIGPLADLKFTLAGYGCTTCIGNSGPLPGHIEEAVTQGNLVAASVLSGNRNFEGRISPHVRANYLASPPLVVAYAIAGNINLDLTQEPLGNGKDGKPVFLKDIWPSPQDVQEVVQKNVSSKLFSKSYSDVFTGGEAWRKLEAPTGSLFEWDADSTYVKEPPYFEGMTMEEPGIKDIRGARVLALLADSITTDHISPAGNISKSSPAAQYLMSRGVQPVDFNSYGARRGHDQVMVRGTFANVRLKNQLVPGVEGGVTKYLPTGEQTSIFDASMKYQMAGTPLIVLAGKEYGTGSSRDWAAKGTNLLGVKAVIAESFERIHRSNLVGMGVIPLQFTGGKSARSLGLDGTETFNFPPLADVQVGQKLMVSAAKSDGSTLEFEALVRIDTPNELKYVKNGGILPYVLRQIVKG